MSALITLKLTAQGTSTGIILPKALLHHMHVEKGDRLFAIETPSGVLLTPYDPSIREQLEVGLKMMDKYRDAYKALAE